MAAEGGDKDIVSYLVKGGANIKSKDKNGVSESNGGGRCLILVGGQTLPRVALPPNVTKGSVAK